MMDFLMEHFVIPWPAFLVGVLIGAFASCRTYSSVVEGVVLIGAASVIALSMAGEFWVLRRARNEAVAALERLEELHRRVGHDIESLR